LTTQGIVRVAAIANRPAPGYQIAAGIGVETEPGPVESVGQAIAEIDQVSYVALIAGDHEVWIQTLRRLHSLPGMRRTSTALLFTSALNDIDSWRIPAGRPQRSGSL
jgi:hypothetical protein